MISLCNVYKTVCQKSELPHMNKLPTILLKNLTML